MNISKNLLQIYPDIDLVSTVNVSSVDGVQSISLWNDPRPQPTQAELDAASIEVARAEHKTAIDNLVSTKIASLFGKPANSLELAFTEVNASGRVSELQEIVINGGTLTAEEQAEKDLIAGAFTMLKAIRANGKTLKTDLLTADPATFDINTGWPI